MSKTIPPICPEPETGRQYWRSLDQLAEKPEFRQWLEREFPSGASEFTDPVTRRHFVKIMSASFMLAGVGLAARVAVVRWKSSNRSANSRRIMFMACRNFLRRPCRRAAVRFRLLAKSYEGRPIKVEGNIFHPDSNGGTDRWAQASILNLYDPDRARVFVKGGNAASADEAIGIPK